MSYTLAEKQQMKAVLVRTSVSSLLYGGIAWGITMLIDGGRKEFIWTLGILIAIRAAYGILEFIIGIIVWRVYGRRTLVNHFVTAMREGKLPKRVYCTDDSGNYFDRIAAPSPFNYKPGEITSDVQKVAAELNRVLRTVRYEQGLVAEVRIRDAMKRAMEIHSPDEDSPHLVSASVFHWIRSPATEAEIQALPHSSVALAKRIIAERPFETLTDIWQLLRSHGLARMEAVHFLNGASRRAERRVE